MELKMSLNNSKLGKIPNISTVPVADCIECDECKAACYALKAYKQYPSVRKAWKNNSQIQRLDDRSTYASLLINWFDSKKKKPELFRIHVAGDFIDQISLDTWIAVALSQPLTNFLAFTKSANLDFSKIPNNLKIIHSQWLGKEKLNKSGVNAWIEGDSRIPKDAFKCEGGAGKDALKCDTCKACWSTDKDVVFGIH
jgi:hypothetical protein